MIVGEAPGATEDEEGMPFIGKSGKIVTAALEKAGCGPNDVYITNAVKCRPPGNRTPTITELEACFKYLDDEVYNLDPAVIMPLGNPALYSTLRIQGITKHAGSWKRVAGPHRDILIIPNYHPAYISRYPEKSSFFEEVVDDFVKVWHYSQSHTTEETWRYARP